MDKNIQITENHYDSIAATSPYKTVLEFMETALEISSNCFHDFLLLFRIKRNNLNPLKCFLTLHFLALQL